jgi:MYXO-CTERM domain-containing protein
VAYQTTIGWSLVSSGIVSIILWLVPGDSVWWGVGLLVLGLAVLYVRRDDVTEAVSALIGS